MFTLFKKDQKLEDAISYIYDEMQKPQTDKDRYKQLGDQLVKLYTLKRKTVDPNVLLTLVGNLSIGLAVLHYEHLNVITSKVWSFLR